MLPEVKFVKRRNFTSRRSRPAHAVSNNHLLLLLFLSFPAASESLFALETKILLLIFSRNSGNMNPVIDIVGRYGMGGSEAFSQKITADKTEDKFAPFAINKRLQSHGGGGGWKMHSLVIHNSRIRASLGKELKEYPVTYETDRELTVELPFTSFVHRWEKILQAERDEPDSETKKYMYLLRIKLSPELADSLQRVQLVEKTGIAEFEDLVFALAPGDTLITNVEIGVEAGILRNAELIEEGNYPYTPLIYPHTPKPYSHPF